MSVTGATFRPSSRAVPVEPNPDADPTPAGGRHDRLLVRPAILVHRYADEPTVLRVLAQDGLQDLRGALFVRNRLRDAGTVLPVQRARTMDTLYDEHRKSVAELFVGLTEEDRRELVRLLGLLREGLRGEGGC